MDFVSGPLTKEFLLSKISQEEIFERFLRIEVQTDTMFKSTLRVDNRPTCNFFYTKQGDLIYKDFSGHFTGNCFQVVKLIYNCDYNNALKIIAKEFNIIKDGSVCNRIPLKVDKQIKKKRVIEIQKLSFNKKDLDYFSKFRITEDILKLFNVGKCNVIWLDKEVIYRNHDKNPAYYYLFTLDDIKIYFPFGFPRFLCNTNRIQGFKQLPKTGNRLIITKSYKDVMSLYSLGLNAIAPQGESQIISKELHENLKSRFKQIYVLYDFDLTGIRSANKMRKLYNYKVIFITNGKFKTRDYKAKDISDYIKLNYVQKIQRQI